VLQGRLWRFGFAILQVYFIVPRPRTQFFPMHYLQPSPRRMCNPFSL